MTTNLSRSRRETLRRLGAGLAATALAAPTFAQTWPTRPVRIICPLPPGSPSDVLARAVAEPLQHDWGQPVVVENRPGATGMIGLDAVAKAPPDGYTVGIAFMSHTILPSLFAKVPYDTGRDLAPICNLVWLYNVLVVPAASPVRTLPELVRFANANPGKLNYGSGGNGSPAHLIAEFFRLRSGIRIEHIPFQGPADAVHNVMAGQIDLMFATTSTAVPQVQGGRLKPLVVTSPSRLAALPDVPTMGEAGISGFDVKEWQGVVAPAGTPAAIIDRWNQGLQRVIRLPAVQERLAGLGMDVAGHNSPQSFRELIRDELARWSSLARELNLRVN